jgi:hypothetical protein
MVPVLLVLFCYILANINIKPVVYMLLLWCYELILFNACLS